MRIQFFKNISFAFLLVTAFSSSSYSSTLNLETADPSAPLGAATTACIHEVLLSIQQQEEEYAPSGGFPKSMFKKSKYTPAPKPTATQCLAHDKKALAGAQSTLAWLSEKAQKVRLRLKTSAGRKTLDAIVRAARIDLSDIENSLDEWSKKLPKKYPVDAVDTFLHYSFQKASPKALDVLWNHITAGVLVGSADEQADLETLCKSFIAINSVLDDCSEKSTLHGAFRKRFTQCYDAIPKTDVIACAMILRHINRVGKIALKTADDGDDIAVESSVLELTEMYAEAMKLWFVDRTQPDIRAYVFATSWRLYHFSKYAPDLFEFCQTNFNAAINARFTKDKWKNWPQTTQTIWVDPKGCISVRLKTDGSKKFTVGFLAENPYYRSYANTLCLDWNILADRRTEMLKFSPYGGVEFHIPGSLLDSETPYWGPASQLLIDDVMTSAHGVTR